MQYINQVSIRYDTTHTQMFFVYFDCLYDLQESVDSALLSLLHICEMTVQVNVALLFFFLAMLLRPVYAGLGSTGVLRNFI